MKINNQKAVFILSAVYAWLLCLRDEFPGG